MSAMKPRAAYCTGCGVTFPKMHLLIDHRRSARCGGRFLPTPERDMVTALRLEHEAQARRARPKPKVRSDLPWWEEDDEYS